MENQQNLFETIGAKTGVEDASDKNSLSYWQDVWRRFKSSKVAIGCVLLILILVAGSILIPMVSPYSISEQDLTNANAGILSEGHILGTDHLGRDLFVRLWYGTRISLTIAVSAVLINLLLGAIYGGISGYFGGKIDEVMMRFVDIIIAIPYLIIVILLMIVLKPGMSTIILAYATVGWTSMARLVRGQVIKLRESEYILAARLLGASAPRIILRHLLSNTLGVILVNLTLTIPAAIFTEAFLSYIGLGVQIPQASLGTLASEGTSGFLLHPHLLLIPGAFLCIAMLTFNLLGDALRDILDPKLGK